MGAVIRVGWVSRVIHDNCGAAFLADTTMHSPQFMSGRSIDEVQSAQGPRTDKLGFMRCRMRVVTCLQRLVCVVHLGRTVRGRIKSVEALKFGPGGSLATGVRPR